MKEINNLHIMKIKIKNKKVQTVKAVDRIPATNLKATLLLI
jgi:hypothetical protein